MKQKDDGMTIDRYSDLCMFEPPEIIEKVESPLPLNPLDKLKSTNHKILPYDQEMHAIED